MNQISPQENPFGKQLKVFVEDGQESFTIDDPSATDLMMAIDRVSAMLESGKICVLAIFDRNDGNYVQFAAESEEYHVEMREIGEPFQHWHLVGLDGNEWLTQQQTLDVFQQFRIDQPVLMGYRRISMNDQFIGNDEDQSIFGDWCNGVPDKTDLE